MFPSLKDIIEEEEAKRFLLFSDKYMERKWDGLASIVSRKDGQVTILGKGILDDGSRQDYTEKFPEIVEEVKQIGYREEFSLLAEIVVLDDPSKENFNRVLTRASRKKDITSYSTKNPAYLIVYDLLSIKGVDIRSKVLNDRKDILHLLLSLTPSQKIIESKVWRTQKEKEENFKVMVEERWEGVVFKGIKGAYGEEQWRYKPRFTTDVFWEGEYLPGKGKHENRIGSLICYQYIDGEKTQVAKVGGGLSDDLRTEFMGLSKIVTKDNPLVMEVQTHKVMPSGKLRFPNFIRVRDDKRPEQCIGHKLESTEKKSVIDLKEWY